MRLIDADDFDKQIGWRTWDIDENYPREEANIRLNECHIINDLLNQRPTIEAIPIEWINEWLDREYVNVYDVTGVGKMLDDWRKENESDTGN